MGARVVSPARRAVYALLPLLVLLGLAEAALRIGGLGDHAQHVSRGFDGRARYLVPVGGVPGAFRTHMFDDPASEVLVPAKDGRVRVLLFGGSNTQLFPEGILQALLDGDAEAGLAPGARSGPAPDVSAGTRYEVVNLGREGYGSARVSILLEQAVAVLAPDVVVIHSGHNEFIESAFEDELRRSRGGSLTGGERALSHLRLFGVVRDLLAPPASLDPEPMQRDPARRPLARAETEAHYARYADNLARMVAAAHAAGARVVLCTLAGNMLSAPYLASGPDGPPADVLERVERLRSKALKLVPEVDRAGLRPPLRLRVARYSLGRVVDPSAPWTPPEPRVLGGMLADTRATAGEQADSVDGAHWPDPSLWDWDVRVVQDGYARLLRRELDAATLSDLDQARGLLGEALSISPGHPTVLFDLGLVHWLLGDDAAAAEALQAAMDEDRAPRCANGPINAAVRAAAAAAPFVELVDVDALVRAACPAGLVGYEVLMDNCHLQPGVRVALMRVLADVVRAPTPR